jgi:hypothetical protein
MQRVELTHDVLTDVVRVSRDHRKQRQAELVAQDRERKLKKRIRVNQGLLIALLCFAVLGGWIISRQNERLESRTLVLAQVLEGLGRVDRALLGSITPQDSAASLSRLDSISVTLWEAYAASGDVHEW